MKKLRYSMLFKTSAFLLQQVFIVVFVLSIVLASFLFHRHILDMSGLKNKPFAESEYFEQIFKQSMNDVLRFTSYRERFETSGLYDPEKIINVRDYMNQDSFSNGIADSGIEATYYLEDLYHWSREEYRLIDSSIEFGFFISENGSMLQRRTISVDGSIILDEETKINSMSDLFQPLQYEIAKRVEHSYGGNYDAMIGPYQKTDYFSEIPKNYMVEEKQFLDTQAQVDDKKSLLDDSIEKVIQGDLYQLKGESLIILLEDLGFVNYSNSIRDTFVREDYLPLQFDSSILERFLSGSITFEEMQQLYDGLKLCLSVIGEEVSFYKKNLNTFDKNDTNLNYWIVDGSKQILYSNIKDPNAVGRDLLSYGEEKGGYFYYNEPETHLVSNIRGMEDEFYDQYENIYQGRNRIIFLSIDTSFPINDKINEAGREYNSLLPWVSISLIALGISLFGYLLCFVYSTAAAGITEQGENIKLYGFDKIKTEILLAGFIMSGIFLLFSYLQIAEQFDNREMIGLLVTCGFLAFLGNLLLMLFYLSFVRRLKASTIWKNSIVYWSILRIQELMRNRKSTTKIILLLVCQMVLISVLFAMQINNTIFIVPILILLFEFVIFAREGIQRNKLMDGIKKISDGDLEYKIDTLELKGDNRVLGEAINTIGEGLYRAVDDSMKNERLKADLITNVSHDIKTPLTSIINYVDLIKREEIQNKRVQNYIKVLDNKSQRLKQLTEDLVEASKVASGNVILNMDRLNFVELIHQIGGESAEKFEEKNLTTIMKMPKEPIIIVADGRRIWRVIENLYHNAAKYAMENTRIYVDMYRTNGYVVFSMKNISAQPLNINADELTERFIRGDVSRSTEGSGLGLSIAKSLTELMNGVFEIYLDGDLFKVTISFSVAAEEGDL